MMKIGVLSLFLLLFLSLNAQEECEYLPSKKAAKLLEQAEDKKKYDGDKRKEFLSEALESDPQCLPCMMELGSSAFKSAKHSGGSFREAEQYLEELIRLCPEYHSEPYYFLGAINYATGNYEQAETYFDKFLHFPDEDASKFRKDYEKRYEEVMEALPYVQFYKEFYGDEIEFKPRIVSGVSDMGDEYLPMLSPDNELMFYTRKSSKKAKGDIVARMVEEFTMSSRSDINADFDSGEALPRPFNLGDNYGGASISINNKEMYITKKNPNATNPENFDIYRTRFERGTDEQGKPVYRWSELELLGPEVNTEDGWEAQPSLSADGNLLFFATVRPACKPGKTGDPSTDIFYAERQKDGSWGQAKSLGDAINTDGSDKAPFMHSDSKTLYFASNGRLGAGGFDIYYSRMNEDGSWTTPKNIGHPINTPEDEHGLIVSTDGELAYYASRGVQGARGFDIISFKMPEKARPDKVLLVKGEVKDEQGRPLADTRIEIKYAQSEEKIEFEVDEDDGKYAAIVNLERKEDVLLAVKGKDIAFNSRIIAKKEDERQPAVVKLSMETAETKAQKPFLINDIYYLTSSADIDESSKLILNEFADYLKENISLQIEIRGHTDDVGAAESNLALSMDRAFEVKGYLETQGIEGRRITAKGFGESMPVEDNSTEAGRAKNRRTEFVIRKM